MHLVNFSIKLNKEKEEKEEKDDDLDSFRTEEDF